MGTDYTVPNTPNTAASPAPPSPAPPSPASSEDQWNDLLRRYENNEMDDVGLQQNLRRSFWFSCPLRKISLFSKYDNFMEDMLGRLNILKSLPIGTLKTSYETLDWLQVKIDALCNGEVSFY